MSDIAPEVVTGTPSAGEQRPVAVIDVDGVVADVRHRVPHLERRPRDWDAFFAAAGDDTPLAVGVSRVQALAADHDIVWLTGRPEHLRTTTLDWFARHDLPSGRLIMRRGNDRRPAKIVKRAELRRLAAGRKVDIVIDDDPAVVSALAADGWPVELADWIPYAPEMGTAQEESGRT
ncbi:MAG TPA: hypothetical protein VHZ96_01670 [Frankiaceae bacterium]|jgi:hypothetical protein|nr:hypothetical protein [Frankiaceae bacterium]